MWFKRIALVGISLILVFLTQSCFQFRLSDKKQWLELAEINKTNQVEIGERDCDGRIIHYTLVHSDYNLPLAVFVHGSPGSSSNFLSFAKDTNLLKKYNILLVDRPGFGYSDFGKPVTSIAKQANLLNLFLGGFNYSKTILVGHSLGGPIICRMAIDEPSKYKGLFIVAGSVSPELEPEDKYRYVLNSKLVRWMLPNTLDVSNQEILPAKQELLNMEPFWKNISCKVVIMQGQDDNLVPPRNADYAEKMLVNASELKVIRLAEMNHFIPFTKPELMTDVLLSF